jgi:uncharacterized protein (DUF433 family)
MQLPDFLTQDPDGTIRLSGHRIGLHHLARFYAEGYSPEMLLEQFPTLSLPLIHRTIALYLENRLEVDAFITASDQQIAQQRTQAPAGPTLDELRRRFEAKRRAEAL